MGKKTYFGPNLTLFSTLSNNTYLRHNAAASLLRIICNKQQLLLRIIINKHQIHSQQEEIIENLPQSCVTVSNADTQDQLLTYVKHEKRLILVATQGISHIYR